MTQPMIEAALDRDAFELWFQPIVCLRSCEVRGFEGLARCRTHDGEVRLPGDFIATIEADHGLYRRFTDVMIDQAAAFAARCRDEAGQAPVITVNLAEASLRDRGLPERVAAVLAHHAIPARQLMFEITEREFIHPDSAHSEVLEGLSALGVGLTIDDFGTGWSSLDTLRWLPLSQLKIDRGFVDHIADHAADRIIVDKVIELAHELHLLVIAEGIESAEQLAELRSVGCDRGQGFLFSPAVEPEAAIRLAVDGFVEQGPSVPSAPRTQAGEDGPGSSRSFSVDSDADCIGSVIDDPSALCTLALQTLDLVPLAVFVKAIDGRIVWANESHWRRLGASSLDEVRELRDVDLHRIDEALRYRYDDLVIVTTGEASIDRREFQTRPDGTRVTLRTSKYPVRNRAGTIVGLIGFYVEVGEEGQRLLNRDLERLAGAPGVGLDYAQV